MKTLFFTAGLVPTLEEAKQIAALKAITRSAGHIDPKSNPEKADAVAGLVPSNYTGVPVVATPQDQFDLERRAFEAAHSVGSEAEETEETEETEEGGPQLNLGAGSRDAEKIKGTVAKTVKEASDGWKKNA